MPDHNCRRESTARQQVKLRVLRTSNSAAAMNIITVGCCVYITTTSLYTSVNYLYTGLLELAPMKNAFWLITSPLHAGTERLLALHDRQHVYYNVTERFFSKKRGTAEKCREIRAPRHATVLSRCASEKIALLLSYWTAETCISGILS